MNSKATISLSPIGVVRNNITDAIDENWGNVVSRLVLHDEFKHGLQGLDQFSHAIGLTFLHNASFDPRRDLVRRPRGLESMPSVGIFSQRARDRPNPIGVTAVAIVGIADGHVDVRGLDAINGTPILDIKPYYPHYDLVADAVVPEWLDRLMQHYFKS